jgi:hypothetical protein
MREFVFIHKHSDLLPNNQFLMSKLYTRHFIALIYLFAFSVAKGQTNKLSTNDGTWQDYGGAVSASTYPEFYGRLVNVNWSDIEDAPNHWHWDLFDTDVSQHIANGMPIIILVYTGPAAPNWIYTVGGVPKVKATNNAGDSVAFSPYYLDTDYNNYFKRMIDSVKQHIQSYPSSTRNLIIAMQGCYGSTGDQIAYKGNVAPQYQITSTQFDSLFKVYSLYYYNTYKNFNPPIRLLSNPSPTDSSETNWLMSNCPGGWIKCGTFAKGSQVNLESDKQKWMYNILNQPQNGQFVMARCEITGSQLSSGKWIKNHYKEMFGIMCYDIYWGLDWPNETTDIIMNSNYDSTFAFFNKYAGQKIPGVATNAMCALKDALDVSDSTRFPAGTYGTVSQTNTSRYINIYNAYSSYGAKLEDTAAAILNDLGSISSNGINDVGWHLLPGNYERYLRQINANATSAGYWNINTADTTCMYGRYARGFDIANNKTGLYFDVDDNFLRNAPLNGAYPATIQVTYLDSGYGSWQLFYDAVGNNNKASIKTTCANTKKWIKAQVTLTDANFGNGSISNSDFYIKNTGTQNVIFSVVELSRAQLADSGFITTSLNKFDTVCINSVVSPNSFILHASTLNGGNVQIGPFTGYSFSASATGNFTDSLIINNYGNAINQTIYVNLKTANAGSWSGNIPITGGGKKKAFVSVAGNVVNSSPILNAVVVNVSCYNNKNGSIDLQPTGGSGVFTYKWTNNIQQSWNTNTQDLSSLQPANYTVVVNSAYGCSTSKTFAITQPQQLVTSVTQDSSIVCRGGATTVTVFATGGTLPYTGAGSFAQSAGFVSYTINDANGCSSVKGITVPAGTLTAPAKPVGITGPTSASSKQTGVVFSVTNSISSTVYTWSVPSDATIVSGQGTPSITVTWGVTAGSVTVSAGNVCGNSVAFTSKIALATSLSATATTLPGNDEITLMPNPVKDVATVRFSTATSGSYSIMISDVNGKILMTRKNTSFPGINLERFDVANFPAGMYLITLIDQTGTRRTLKMIKQ